VSLIVEVEKLRSCSNRLPIEMFARDNEVARWERCPVRTSPSRSLREGSAPHLSAQHAQSGFSSCHRQAQLYNARRPARASQRALPWRRVSLARRRGYPTLFWAELQPFAGLVDVQQHLSKHAGEQAAALHVAATSVDLLTIDCGRAGRYGLGRGHEHEARVLRGFDDCADRHLSGPGVAAKDCHCVVASLRARSSMWVAPQRSKPPPSP
jgi:hypothetical protein